MRVGRNVHGCADLQIGVSRSGDRRGFRKTLEIDIAKRGSKMGDDEGADKLFLCRRIFSGYLCAGGRGRETIIDLIGTFFFLSLLFISPSRPLCSTKRELIRFKSG